MMLLIRCFKKEIKYQLYLYGKYNMDSTSTNRETQYQNW
jgi:hypothetical protein